MFCNFLERRFRANRVVQMFSRPSFLLPPTPLLAWKAATRPTGLQFSTRFPSDACYLKAEKPSHTFAYFFFLNHPADF